MFLSLPLVTEVMCVVVFCQN